MDVGRVDRDPRGVLLDADDPVERVLVLFDFLLVARQAKHLLPVLCGEGAAQRHDAGRELVVDPPARGTQLFDSARSPSQPLPASVLVYGTALGTDRPLVQLFLPLIGIEDVVLLGVSGDPAVPRNHDRPVLRYVSCFHMKILPVNPRAYAGGCHGSAAPIS
jgi:hypothetical protein